MSKLEEFCLKISWPSRQDKNWLSSDDVKGKSFFHILCVTLNAELIASWQQFWRPGNILHWLKYFVSLNRCVLEPPRKNHTKLITIQKGSFLLFSFVGAKNFVYQQVLKSQVMLNHRSSRQTFDTEFKIVF